ncbi:MAG: hypothetical protein ABFR75_07915 [Acidobacteriota bacterium]
MKKILILSIFFLMIFLPVNAKGNWEVGIHYSTWTIDMIAPFVEDITPDLEHYDPEKGSLNFDSNGNNYGIELRYFPAGKNGSFSMGISYERNNFRADLTGAYSDVIDGFPVTASASGSIEMLPHSFNFNVRWELWPKSRVHPYFGFGFGVGAQDGTFSYYAKAITTKGGIDIIEEETDTYTFDELISDYEEEEGKTFPVSVFPIIHIQFGIRGEVTDNLYLLAEVAVYDGLIFRGGIAYRF